MCTGVESTMSPAESASRSSNPAGAAPKRVVLGLETSGPGGAEAMLVQLALGLNVCWLGKHTLFLGP